MEHDDEDAREAADLITTLSTAVEALKEERDAADFARSETDHAMMVEMERRVSAESSLAEAQLRIAGLEAALREIAAFHDVGASKYLADLGSYGGFDEPGSVEIARRALSET